MAASTQPEVLLRQGDAVVLTRSKKDLDKKLDALRRGGADKLQVIADFDQTLTRFSMADGRRSRSTHGLLDSQHLSEEFRADLRTVFSQYNPYAMDHADHDTKMAYLEEGWRKAHTVLVTHRVTRNDIQKCVEGGTWALRDDFPALLSLLRRASVPLLIFSAGIADVLSAMLRHALDAQAARGVRVVSNRILFDSNGHATGYSEPVIHSMNKGAVALDSHSPVLDLSSGGDVASGPGGDVVEEWGDVIAGRSNVVLLGDSLGDLQMADGVPDRQTMLSIAFLNDKVAEKEAEFLANFDIVIEGDPSLSFATHFLAPLLAADLSSDRRPMSPESRSS